MKKGIRPEIIKSNNKLTSKINNNNSSINVINQSSNQNLSYKTNTINKANTGLNKGVNQMINKTINLKVEPKNGIKISLEQGLNKSSNKDLKQRSTQKITTDLNQESTQSTIKATSTNQIINPFNMKPPEYKDNYRESINEIITLNSRLTKLFKSLNVSSNFTITFKNLPKTYIDTLKNPVYLATEDYVLSQLSTAELGDLSKTVNFKNQEISFITDGPIQIQDNVINTIDNEGIKYLNVNYLNDLTMDDIIYNNDPDKYYLYYSLNEKDLGYTLYNRVYSKWEKVNPSDNIFCIAKENKLLLQFDKSNQQWNSLNNYVFLNEITTDNDPNHYPDKIVFLQQGQQENVSFILKKSIFNGYDTDHNKTYKWVDYFEYNNIKFNNNDIYYCIIKNELDDNFYKYIIEPTNSNNWIWTQIKRQETVNTNNTINYVVVDNVINFSKGNIKSSEGLFDKITIGNPELEGEFNIYYKVGDNIVKNNVIEKLKTFDENYENIECKSILVSNQTHTENPFKFNSNDVLYARYKQQVGSNTLIPIIDVSNININGIININKNAGSTSDTGIQMVNLNNILHNLQQISEQFTFIQSINADLEMPNSNSYANLRCNSIIVKDEEDNILELTNKEDGQITDKYHMIIRNVIPSLDIENQGLPSEYYNLFTDNSFITKKYFEGNQSTNITTPADIGTNDMPGRLNLYGAPEKGSEYYASVNLFYKTKEGSASVNSSYTEFSMFGIETNNVNGDDFTEPDTFKINTMAVKRVSSGTSTEAEVSNVNSIEMKKILLKKLNTNDNTRIKIFYDYDTSNLYNVLNFNYSVLSDESSNDINLLQLKYLSANNIELNVNGNITASNNITANNITATNDIIANNNITAQTLTFKNTNELFKMYTNKEETNQNQQFIIQDLNNNNKDCLILDRTKLGTNPETYTYTLKSYGFETFGTTGTTPNLYPKLKIDNDGNLTSYGTLSANVFKTNGNDNFVQIEKGDNSIQSSIVINKGKFIMSNGYTTSENPQLIPFLQINDITNNNYSNIETTKDINLYSKLDNDYKFNEDNKIIFLGKFPIENINYGLIKSDNFIFNNNKLLIQTKLKINDTINENAGVIKLINQNDDDSYIEFNNNRNNLNDNNTKIPTLFIQDGQIQMNKTGETNPVFSVNSDGQVDCKGITLNDNITVQSLTFKNINEIFKMYTKKEETNQNQQFIIQDLKNNNKDCLILDRTNLRTDPETYTYILKSYGFEIFDNKLKISNDGNINTIGNIYIKNSLDNNTPYISLYKDNNKGVIKANYFETNDDKNNVKINDGNYNASLNDNIQSSIIINNGQFIMTNGIGTNNKEFLKINEIESDQPNKKINLYDNAVNTISLSASDGIITANQFNTKNNRIQLQDNNTNTSIIKLLDKTDDSKYIEFNNNDGPTLQIVDGQFIIQTIPTSSLNEHLNDDPQTTPKNLFTIDSNGDINLYDKETNTSVFSVDNTGKLKCESFDISNVDLNCKSLLLSNDNNSISEDPLLSLIKNENNKFNFVVDGNKTSESQETYNTSLKIYEGSNECLELINNTGTYTLKSYGFETFGTTDSNPNLKISNDGKIICKDILLNNNNSSFSINSEENYIFIYNDTTNDQNVNGLYYYENNQYNQDTTKNEYYIITGQNNEFDNNKGKLFIYNENSSIWNNINCNFSNTIHNLTENDPTYWFNYDDNTFYEYKNNEWIELINNIIICNRYEQILSTLITRNLNLQNDQIEMKLNNETIFKVDSDGQIDCKGITLNDNITVQSLTFKNNSVDLFKLSTEITESTVNKSLIIYNNPNDSTEPILKLEKTGSNIDTYILKSYGFETFETTGTSPNLQINNDGALITQKSITINNGQFIMTDTSSTFLQIVSSNGIESIKNINLYSDSINVNNNTISLTSSSGIITANQFNTKNSHIQIQDYDNDNNSIIKLLDKTDDSKYIEFNNNNGPTLQIVDGRFVIQTIPTSSLNEHLNDDPQTTPINLFTIDSNGVINLNEKGTENSVFSVDNDGTLFANEFKTNDNKFIIEKDNNNNSRYIRLNDKSNSSNYIEFNNNIDDLINSSNKIPTLYIENGQIKMQNNVFTVDKTGKITGNQIILNSNSSSSLNNRLNEDNSKVSFTEINNESIKIYKQDYYGKYIFINYGNKLYKFINNEYKEIVSPTFKYCVSKDNNNTYYLYEYTTLWTKMNINIDFQDNDPPISHTDKDYCINKNLQKLYIYINNNWNEILKDNSTEKDYIFSVEKSSIDNLNDQQIKVKLNSDGIIETNNIKITDENNDNKIYVGKNDDTINSFMKLVYGQDENDKYYSGIDMYKEGNTIDNKLQFLHIDNENIETINNIKIYNNNIDNNNKNYLSLNMDGFKLNSETTNSSDNTTITSTITLQPKSLQLYYNKTNSSTTPPTTIDKHNIMLDSSNGNISADSIKIGNKYKISNIDITTDTSNNYLTLTITDNDNSSQTYYIKLETLNS